MLAICPTPFPIKMKAGMSSHNPEPFLETESTIARIKNANPSEIWRMPLWMVGCLKRL
jgi:hypothetical protein